MVMRVVLDANVLVPFQICDILMRLAEAEIIEPLWSDEILNEVHRTLTGKIGVHPDRADRRIQFMRRTCRHAVVDNLDPLIDTLTNDPKDRHVLAAAILGRADIIVTANTKHFPPAAVDLYGIEVLDPDTFLLQILDESPQTAEQVIHQAQIESRRPTVARDEYLDHLHNLVPAFVNELRTVGTPVIEGDLPGALVIGDEQTAEEAMLRDGVNDSTTPLGALCTWRAALNQYADNQDPLAHRVLQKLTYAPDSWDFTEAQKQLGDLGLAQFGHPYSEDPERLIGYKLIPNVHHTMQAFGFVPVAEFVGILLVKDVIGWAVWGYSHNRFPTHRELMGDDPL